MNTDFPPATDDENEASQLSQDADGSGSSPVSLDAESVQTRLLIAFSIEGWLGQIPQEDLLDGADRLLTKASMDQHRGDGGHAPHAQSSRAAKKRRLSSTDQFWLGGGWRRLGRRTTQNVGTTDGAVSNDESSDKSFEPVQVTAHHSYVDDYLPNVQSFLFDGLGSAGTAYWRFFDPDASSWFNGSRLALLSKNKIPDGDFAMANGVSVALSKDSGVELFINRMGVGVLSISLVMVGPINTRQVQELNHKLATGQLRAWFMRPSFAGYAESPETPTPARLRSDKDAFHFAELVDWLLAPLENTHCVRREPRASLNTCVHLSGDHDLDDMATRQRVLQVLSHLSQLHPASHPGEIGAEEFGESLMINRRHIAALGLAGVAHAVASQLKTADGKDNPNDGRQRRRGHFDYFVAWLLALIQRLALQQVLNRAGHLLEQRRKLEGRGHAYEVTPAGAGDHGYSGSHGHGENDDWNRKLSELDRRQSELRWRMLSFCLEGEFVLVSPRRTVQRFHETAQRVCEVPEGLSSSRRALEDWDSARQLEKNAVLATQLSHSVNAIKEMQSKIEWLEVFIIMVYAMEVGHIMSAVIGFGHNAFLAISMLTLSVAGGVLGFLLLRPADHSSPGTVRRMARLGFLLLVSLGLFVAANQVWNPGEDDHSHGKGTESDHSVDPPDVTEPHAAPAPVNANSEPADASSPTNKASDPPRDE